MLRKQTLAVAHDVTSNLGSPLKVNNDYLKNLSLVYKKDLDTHYNAAYESIDYTPTELHDNLISTEIDELAAILSAVKQVYRTEALLVTSQLADSIESSLNQYSEASNNTTLVYYYLPQVVNDAIIRKQIENPFLVKSQLALNQLRNKINFGEVPTIEELKRYVVTSGLISPDATLDVLADVNDETLLNVYRTFFTKEESSCAWVDWTNDTIIENIDLYLTPQSPYEYLVTIFLVVYFSNNIPENSKVTLNDYQDYIFGISNLAGIALKTTVSEVERYTNANIIIPKVVFDRGNIIGYVLGNTIDRLATTGALPINVSEKIIALLQTGIQYVTVDDLEKSDLIEQGEYRLATKAKQKEEDLYRYSLKASIDVIDTYCRLNNIQFDLDTIQSEFTDNIYHNVILFVRKALYKGTYISPYMKALNEISIRVNGLEIEEIEGRALIYLACYIVAERAQVSDKLE